MAKGKDAKRENYFDVFVRNYKASKAFASFVKLCGYLVFIFIICLVAALANGQKEEPSPMENHQETSVTINDLLANLNTITNYTIRISGEFLADGSEKIYLLDLVNGEEISGYLQTDDVTMKIKFQDHRVYKENISGLEETDALDTLDGNLLDIKQISSYFTSSPIKYRQDDVLIYQYQELNESDYQGEVHIQDDKIVEIIISNALKKYEYTFVS